MYHAPMLAFSRWCSDHRRIVVVLWVALIVVTFGGWRTAGSHFANNFSLREHRFAEGCRSAHRAGFPAQSGDRDQIVVRADNGADDAGCARTPLDRCSHQVAKAPNVTAGDQPVPTGTAQISKDGTIGFATVAFDQRANPLPTGAIKRVIADGQARAPLGLQVELGGQAIQQAQQVDPSGSPPHRRGRRDSSCCWSASARCSRWVCRS